MAYDPADAEVLETQRLNVIRDFHDVMLENVGQASKQSKEVREYLNYGVGRRLNVIQLSIQKIYELFPPSQEEALPKETIHEVQVYLQAFVINVSGIFDNWAWAFILRHNLLDKIGGKFGVGMFLPRTQQCLPAILRDYITTEPRVSWHKKYMKDYRDALAHRIPLYGPPSTIPTKDIESYKQMEVLKQELYDARNWVGLERVSDEQDALGKAYPVFLKEFSNRREGQPIPFHPQLNADGALVIEFAKKFYGAWHEFVEPVPKKGGYFKRMLMRICAKIGLEKLN
jgi:hypothetical protein